MLSQCIRGKVKWRIDRMMLQILLENELYIYVRPNIYV